MQRMLDLGADAGLGPLDSQQQYFDQALLQLLDGVAFDGNTPPGIRGVLLLAKILLQPSVPDIAIYAG